MRVRRCKRALEQQPLMKERADGETEQGGLNGDTSGDSAMRVLRGKERVAGETEQGGLTGDTFGDSAMRVRRCKRALEQQPLVKERADGETEQGGLIGAPTCANSNGAPSLFIISEKIDPAAAKDLEPQPENCSGGDLVSEQDIVEVEKGPPKEEGGAVHAGGGRCGDLGGRGLSPGIGGRKGLKSARLRAWKKYFRTEKAKLMLAERNGNLELKREIGLTWKSMSQADRDGYVCVEQPVDNVTCCEKGNVVGRTLSTRCCPGRVYSLKHSMSSAQADVVNQLGFGSILSVAEVNIKRDLCVKLIENLDLNLLELNYEGVRTRISASELGRIMGLPDEGSDVQLYGLVESIKEFKESLCSHVRGIPVNELVLKIECSEDTGKQFRVMMTLLVMYTVLAPGSGVVIPHRFLHGAVDASSNCKKNWSKWSFDNLIAGIRKFKRKKSQQYVCGNLLFLQTAFLEAASAGASFVPRNIVPIVGKAMIKKWMRKVDRSVRLFALQQHGPCSRTIAFP